MSQIYILARFLCIFASLAHVMQRRHAKISDRSLLQNSPIKETKYVDNWLYTVLDFPRNWLWKNLEIWCCSPVLFWKQNKTIANTLKLPHFGMSALQNRARAPWKIWLYLDNLALLCACVEVLFLWIRIPDLPPQTQNACTHFHWGSHPQIQGSSTNPWICRSLLPRILCVCVYKFPLGLSSTHPRRIPFFVGSTKSSCIKPRESSLEHGKRDWENVAQET